MGEVYRARDTKLQRDVALKSLSSSSVSVRVFLLPFLSLWSVTQIFTSWNPLMNWMRSVDLVRRVA